MRALSLFAVFLLAVASFVVAAPSPKTSALILRDSSIEEFSAVLYNATQEIKPHIETISGAISAEAVVDGDAIADAIACLLAIINYAIVQLECFTIAELIPDISSVLPVILTFLDLIGNLLQLLTTLAKVLTSEVLGLVKADLCNLVQSILNLLNFLLNNLVPSVAALGSIVSNAISLAKALLNVLV